ncbi:transcription initiation protein SPT3 homolog isoform X2 [Anabrus simplex]
MMHAFGDNPIPLQSSVNLVETVVYQQMQLLLHRATDIAVLRGSKSIGIEELLFLMRKDRVKINRLLNYLAVKDMKASFLGTIEDAGDNGAVTGDPVSPPKKRKRMCLDYLKTIDQTGELTEKECQPFDSVKHERNVRAELMSQQLDENRYIKYSHARRVSFKVAYSRSHKLRDWLLSKGEIPDLPKSSSLVYEILCYLAYETVAQIVDLALLVRQDAAAQPGDAFSYYVAGFTRMPGYYPPQHTAELSGKQIGGPPPLTPAEIQEALRRYWSPQLCPWSPFSKTVPEYINTRLLTC